MDYGFDWVSQNGIPDEKDYKYTARDGQCKTFTSVFKNVSFKDVPASDPKAMMQALSIGPVSIAINAEAQEFQFYSSGVLDFDCSNQLDHGVLAVGYGHDDSENKDFWIVKNSWGTTWGDQGYVRFVKTDNKDAGLCGILLNASYPTA